WPSLCQMILFLLLFIGGCTASTAGGIKVIRFSIMCELIRRGFYRRIHPRATRAVKLGGTAISAPLVSSVTAFITLFLGVFLVTAAVLSLQGLDFSTTLSASVSLLSTTGSSFGIIGNTGDYSVFCQPIRLFCSLIMIFGRVELYAALLVFVPEFWNPNRSRTVK
ncbi:MAG: potassium transporter TrkG, partial [Anaerovoracaceae bacterium]|nr:potassium transporter TrkG [Anaerovoracaceae bacterium]